MVALLLIGFGFAGCNLNFTTAESTQENTSETTMITGSITDTESSGSITTYLTTDETTTSLNTTTEVITTIPITTTESTTTTETVSTTDVTTEYVERYQEINLFSMNDFHGGAYTDFDNLINIGAYLINQSASGNSVIVSNGDIFQGSALSNYYYGLPIVDIFNYIGFDGFVLGNHEFDWGIEQILKYRDGSLENGEMNYPILAANIVYEDTGLPLENTIPYIVKDINGVKVGIIGVIGDVINSISASRVQNIVFTDAADAIYDYTEILRTTEECDIVVVYAHESSSLDYDIKDFSGLHYVDAIFNGHTHTNESGSISRSSGFPLMYAQASNYDTSLFSRITLVYDRQNQEVSSGSAATISYSIISSSYNQDIDDIIYEYSNDSVYVAFVTQLLAETLYSFNNTDMAPWGASVIRDYAGVDVGALNRGGFRTSMEAGAVTMEDLIVIYPFDNYIKTCEMTGQQLLYFYEKVRNQHYDVVFDDGLTYDGNNLYINGILVSMSGTYTVGAVDYIFDKTNYDFLDGDNITTTTYLMRDLLAQDLLNTTGYFNPNLGTSYLLGFDYYDPSYYMEIKQSLLIQ